MSCLNQLTFKTRSLTIGNGSTLFNTFGCGKCAACQKDKQREYFVRNYCEYMNVKRKGGYAYWDTFTYAPSKVPMDKGYMCFNTNHYRKFTNLLFKRLTSLGYSVRAGALKLFWTSEFGTSDNYVDDCGRVREGSHRPHYHCIFYVYDPRLTPHKLRQVLEEIWYKNGILSGQEHKIGKKMRGLGFGRLDNSHPVVDRVVNSEYIFSYVSKYVTKDIDHLKLTQFLQKNHKPYHRQSQHFGECFKEVLDVKDIIESGSILLPSTSNVKMRYAIPMYFKRKLFYDLNRTDDGRYLWTLNEDGVAFKERHLDDVIGYVTDAYRQQLMNMTFENRSEVNQLLAERDLKDFVTYLLVYRYKLDILRNASRMPYKAFYHYSLTDCPCLVRKSHTEQIFELSDGTEYSVDELATLTITEESDWKFRGFDRLYKFFKSSKVENNQGEQDTYEFKARLLKKFRNMDLL